MPKRDAELLVKDMRSAIVQIESYIAGFNHDSFLEDRRTIDAVVRNLEIIGEAARQLPEEFVARFPEVPWRLLAGLRNRIVHDYFGLDLEIVWQIISQDLLPLKSQLEKTLTE